MAYRVFTLPVHNPGAAETELNGFLASHLVLSVDRRFVEEGGVHSGRSPWISLISRPTRRRLMVVSALGGMEISSRSFSLSGRMCTLGS